MRDVQTLPLTQQGRFTVSWGGQPFQVEITHLPNGQVRVGEYSPNGAYQGFVQQVPSAGAFAVDYIRVLRDPEFAVASNGYYASFANDPDGQRGTGGYCPETGQGNGSPELVKWLPYGGEYAT